MKSIVKYYILIFIVIITACENREWDNPNDPNRNYFNYGSVYDIDGNRYNTIQIGYQTWMTENLRTTKYRDGTAIPNITDETEWSNLTTGAYCWYNNGIMNKAFHGALYNWYAVNTGKLCPEGWHVPTQSEWVILSDCLGGHEKAGYKMKCNDLYKTFGSGSNSGFDAHLSGTRFFNGDFNQINNDTYWWSSTESHTESAIFVQITDLESILNISNTYKKFGFSIRCIKD